LSGSTNGNGCIALVRDRARTECCAVGLTCRCEVRPLVLDVMYEYVKSVCV
jgi:hypothetical protein